MENFILGCDVAKKEIQVALLNKVSGKIVGTRKFANSASGFIEAAKWAQHKAKTEKVSVICEATGVYHENMVDFFYENGYEVYVISPKVIKDYIKSNNCRYKNDKNDAIQIAFFGTTIGTGASKVWNKPWQPYSPVYKEIRAGIRMLCAVKKTLRQFKNRMEALKFSASTPKDIICSVETLIEELEETIKVSETRIQDLIAQDVELSRKINQITSIKGVGWLTAITVVSETNGFSTFTNARQLTAYVGLDVPDNQSGRCRKPGHISKCGNSIIRGALYMPALSMCTTPNGIYYQTYCRLLTRFGDKAKTKAITSIMRRLLCLIFALWKKDISFDPNHIWTPKPMLKIVVDNTEA